MAARKRKPYIYRCHMGFVMVAVPIVVNDHYLGVILNGQLLVEKDNLEKLTRIFEPTIKIENYPDLKEAYESYSGNLQVIPLQKFEAYSRLLHCIANYIAEIGVNNIMQQQLNENKIKLLQESNTKAELEKSLAQLELKNIQTQMTPNYLLNTLSSLHQMAILEDAAKTSEIIFALCQLLRKSLQKRDQIITIGEDLEYINNYLLIKKFAIQDRIKVKTFIDNSCLDFNIPSYTLQPLVENAFIHGLEPKEEGGTLYITIARENTNIRIEIDDDGLGMSNEMVQQILGLDSKQSRRTNITSLGVNNVIKTLKYYFGEAFKWDLNSNLGQGTRITLFIPYKQ